MIKKGFMVIPVGYRLCVVVMMMLLVKSSCRQIKSSPFSESAVQALESFELAPGFKLELVASEPLLTDPVAMTIDENGKMYVVEMSGMPLDRSGIGKVVVLSDTDLDGKMDKRVVFADSLIMPSGIMRWKKGVIVTDPPHVYYMEDTDGDDKSDIRELMLTGFDTSNLEGNVNNPLYGLDNWIYLASSMRVRDTSIRFADDTSGFRLREGSLRFRPGSRQIEVLSAKSQFGHTFDKWGNHLMLNNHYHIFQEVIPARYVERNPDLVVRGTTQLLADHSEVFPITVNPEYQMLTEVGVFTAACGLTTYLGGAFPEAYNENTTFVCEPASNVIHADRLRDSGVTFRADRILERREFLASTDPYSRMVNLYVGPDGALYALDFYRQVIEGPEFMSEEVLKKVNLYNGNDKGRIYRISPAGTGPLKWTGRLRLGEASNAELVGHLNHKNIWWRMNAQRLLVDRNPSDAIPLLQDLALNPKTTVGRLHALWTLEGMNKLSSDLILAALTDSGPGIRVNAIKLAELHLAADPRLADALLKMSNDPNPKVRFQLVSTLGGLDIPEARNIAQTLLFKDVTDKWMQIAVLSAGSSYAVALLDSALTRFDPSIGAYTSLIQLLGGIVGKSQTDEVVRYWLRKGAAISPVVHKWQPALLDGLSQGLQSRGSLPRGLDPERQALINACLADPSPALGKSALLALKVIGVPNPQQIRAAMSRAVAVAGDTSLSQQARALAIDFMALGNPSSYINFLRGLISPRTPVMVQLAAIRSLGVIEGEEESIYLLQNWRGLTPELRTEAVNVFLASDHRIKLLLDKVEAGEINQGAITWDQSVHLRSGGQHMHRARELLTDNDQKRREVIGQYREALETKGDVDRGKAVYQMNCAVCHQVAGKLGRSFGPDLGTVYAWPPEDILTNILDPNRSIALGFDMWSAQLNNGQTVHGIISSETPAAITLINVAGESATIARQDISSLTTLGISAMPVDFESKIDKQQMADLLAFLKQVQ